MGEVVVTGIVICNDCGVELPLNQKFYSSMEGGRILNFCEECISKSLKNLKDSREKTKSNLIKSSFHTKFWGEEKWIVNTEKYCMKVLTLLKDFHCSIHYHKLKDETFHILSGKVELRLDEDYFVLHPGDTIRVTPNTKHRFLGLEDSTMLEVSTQHLEEDSYRLSKSGRITQNDIT